MCESGNIYNSFTCDLPGLNVTVPKFNTEEFRPKTKSDKNRKRRKIRVKIPKALANSPVWFDWFIYLVFFFQRGPNETRYGLISPTPKHQLKVRFFISATISIPMTAHVDLLKFCLHTPSFAWQYEFSHYKLHRKLVTWFRTRWIKYPEL